MITLLLQRDRSPSLNVACPSRKCSGTNHHQRPLLANAPSQWAVWRVSEERLIGPGPVGEPVVRRRGGDEEAMAW